MGKVRKSVYRQPVTPDGLKKIESGELRWFDLEMFSNLNTGVLEQYLDEKNRGEGFGRSRFIWWKVFIGILIGISFAVINQYIGLKIGLITSGSLYVSYLVGMSLRWSTTDINVASGGAGGADKTCTGLVFTFPAIYLLAYSTRYVGEGGVPIVNPNALGQILPIVLVSVILAAFLGVLYFIIFRRIWLVEDPLPTPGIEAQIKLLDIANDIEKGTVEHAKHSIRLVRNWILGVMGFAFIRDFPILGSGDERTSLIDSLVGSEYYSKGVIHMSYEQSVYTHIGFALQGVQLAIGWFMKSRVAILVAVGSLFTWLVIVPMIVAFEVPIYVPYIDNYVSPLAFPREFILPNGEKDWLLGAASPAHAADLGVAKIIAIGAILGGGITALLKMAPTFKTVLTDVQKSTKTDDKDDKIIKRKSIQRKDWVPYKGWYEWPLAHIKPMMIIAAIGIGVIFSIGGFPIIPSFIFSILLVGLTFLLGAIAIKVGGEVGTTPVSGTSFLCLLLLVGVFSLLNYLFQPFENSSQLVIMALIGTTVFGSAISLSADIIWEFKIAIYTGTRPYYVLKSELLGIMVGVFVSTTAAVFFSRILAEGTLPLEAPQAHAFATFTQILMGGKVMLPILFMGIIIGVFIELLTGMGTAFGLGMYLPVHHTLLFVVGGVARDTWEKRWLIPKAKENNWTERDKTLRLLDTFMVATGLLVGEALLGIILAFYLVFS